MIFAQVLQAKVEHAPFFRQEGLLELMRDVQKVILKAGDPFVAAAVYFDHCREKCYERDTSFSLDDMLWCASSGNRMKQAKLCAKRACFWREGKNLFGLVLM